jgi:hypothetical protein
MCPDLCGISICGAGRRMMHGYERRLHSRSLEETASSKAAFRRANSQRGSVSKLSSGEVEPCGSVREADF